MGEKMGSFSKDDIRKLGYEPTKDEPKFFPPGATIQVVDTELTRATVMGKGFMAQRLKDEKKGRGKPKDFDDDKVTVQDLQNLKVVVEGLHKYFLTHSGTIQIDKYRSGGAMGGIIDVPPGYTFYGY